MKKNGSVTRYVYSAADEKLRVTHLTAVPNITVAIGSVRELLPSENSTYNSDGPNEDIEQDRINGFGYTEGYILPTTPEEDGIIKVNFVKAVNKGYNLITNQCAKGVQKALNSVGIKTTVVYNYNYSTSSSGAVFPMSPHNTVEVNPYLPSLAFKAIRDNNPKGIYIKK